MLIVVIIGGYIFSHLIISVIRGYIRHVGVSYGKLKTIINIWNCRLLLS
jgi:hypothetical protein